MSKKNLGVAIIIAVLWSLGMSSSLFAGSEIRRFGETHEVELDEKGAVDASKAAIRTLVYQALPVDGELLEREWEEIGIEDKSIFKKGSNYYIVKIDNKAAKKVLYLLLNTKGAMYAANFSGIFDGIKD